MGKGGKKAAFLGCQRLFGVNHLGHPLLLRGGYVTV
jgi:hypothetical protein